MGRREKDASCSLHAAAKPCFLHPSRAPRGWAGIDAAVGSIVHGHSCKEGFLSRFLSCFTGHFRNQRYSAQRQGVTEPLDVTPSVTW